MGTPALETAIGMVTAGRPSTLATTARHAAWNSHHLACPPPATGSPAGGRRFSRAPASGRPALELPSGNSAARIAARAARLSSAASAVRSFPASSHWLKKKLQRFGARSRPRGSNPSTVKPRIIRGAPPSPYVPPRGSPGPPAQPAEPLRAPIRTASSMPVRAATPAPRTPRPARQLTELRETAAARSAASTTIGPHHRDQPRRVAQRRRVPGARNPPRRRLQPRDAAEVRRHADGAAAIARHPARRAHRRDRRRLAAARSAGRGSATSLRGCWCPVIAFRRVSASGAFPACWCVRSDFVPRRASAPPR